MTYHLLGLPHTKLNKEFSTCAFTQKVLKMMKMLDMLGEDYLVYAPSDVGNSDKVISCMSEAVWKKTYGGRKKEEMYDRDNREGRSYFNNKCIKEINKRKKEGDILIISYGNFQEDVVRQCELKSMELGIGYEGACNGTYKVFESYAWMNYLTGKWNQQPNDLYDVIPNYFDIDDFKYEPVKEDYVCFIGRLNRDKGPQIAVETAKKLGIKIKVAGQLGNWPIDPYCEYVGVVDFDQRQELMGKAKCCIFPSQYTEPFGAVAVESLLYGTPIITSDNGGFQEINQDGITGYRCRGFDEYVEALNKIDSIDNSNCRKYAVDNYSLEVISKKYRDYFERIKAN